MYSLVESDTARIAMQIGIGTVAWAMLAFSLAHVTRLKRTCVAFTLLLGLSPQVIRYDIAILSESLTISFVVLAIATTVLRLHKQSQLINICWAVSLTLCVLSRPTHVLIAIALVLPVAWRFIRSKGRTLPFSGVSRVALLLVSIFTLQQSPHMSTLNVYTVITSRVISDDNRFNWFTTHGMPNVEGMRNAMGYDYVNQLPPEVASIVDLPVGQQPPSLMRVGGVELAKWVSSSGMSTVVRYLALHPLDTLRHAQLLLDDSLSPPNGDFLPLANGFMLPWGMFLSWQLWTAVVVLAGGLLFLRNSTRQRAQLILSLFLTAIAVYIASIHFSGIEHVRHTVPVAVTLRVIGLVALVSLFPAQRPTETVDEVA